MPLLSRTLLALPVTLVASLPARAQFADSCVQPDDGGGTLELPIATCGRVTTSGPHAITAGLPAGSSLVMLLTLSEAGCGAGSCEIPGGPLGGSSVVFDALGTVELFGTGALSGFNRVLEVPVNCLVDAAPRTPGDPVQSFATDFRSLFGTLPGGDPDFASFTLSGGSSGGGPSPGTTTFTQFPGGHFEADEVTELVLGVSYTGAAGSPLAGSSGTSALQTFTLELRASQALADCTHELRCYDIFGDGWDGATLDLLVNGTLAVQDAAAQGFESAFSFDASTGDALDTIYTSGLFESENLYELRDAFGGLLASDGPVPGGGISVLASCETPPCDHLLRLVDAFGDGWDGARISLAVSGATVLQDVTVPIEEAVAEFLFPASTGAAITTTYTAGNFEGEHSYTIFDGAGFVLGGDGPAPGPGISVTGQCDSTPPAANDDCAMPEPVSLGLTAFDLAGATTDGMALDALVCDLGPFGDEQLHNDLWYCFTAPANKDYRVSTVGLAGFDTRLAVYDNGCGSDDPATVVACNDDFDGSSPFEAELVFHGLPAVQYKIRLGAFDPATAGAGQLLVEEVPNHASFCFGDGTGIACPCGNTGLTPGGGCTNGNGTNAVLTTNGETSVSDNQLTFHLTGGNADTFGVLVSGANALGNGQGIPGIPPADGLRCVGGNLRRHGTRLLSPEGTSIVSWGAPGSGPQAGIIGSSPFFPGQTRFFQVRYREDPLAGPCGFDQNTSQAISITFKP